ncbi:MAG: hypothetical protein QG608_1724 [Actinomycetota bacterium]|nr:hypothetical protein [Actinomycetota bacterium]
MAKKAKATDPEDSAAQSLPRDPEELVALITQQRERLARTLEELRIQSRPDRIARRAGCRTLGGARQALRDENGRLRPGPLAVVAAVAVATTVGVLLAAGRCRGERS